MEPRPDRPPAPLPCKHCPTPLGWLSGDRRRLRIADGVQTCREVDAGTTSLRCPGCGRVRTVKGGTAVFVTLDR